MNLEKVDSVVEALIPMSKVVETIFYFFPLMTNTIQFSMMAKLSSEARDELKNKSDVKVEKNT